MFDVLLLYKKRIFIVYIVIVTNGKCVLHDFSILHYKRLCHISTSIPENLNMLIQDVTSEIATVLLLPITVL